MRVGVALAVIAGVAACDGGPDFFAKVTLNNACSETVYVAALSGNTGTFSDGTDLSDQSVEPGGSLQLVSLRVPVGASISVFVESSPTAPLDERFIVPTAGLEHYVDAEEYDVYVVPITGDMCPG